MKRAKNYLRKYLLHLSAPQYGVFVVVLIAVAVLNFHTLAWWQQLLAWLVTWICADILEWVIEKYAIPRLTP